MQQTVPSRGARTQESRRLAGRLAEQSERLAERSVQRLLPPARLLPVLPVEPLVEQMATTRRRLVGSSLCRSLCKNTTSTTGTRHRAWPCDAPMRVCVASV